MVRIVFLPDREGNNQTDIRENKGYCLGTDATKDLNFGIMTR